MSGMSQRKLLLKSAHATPFLQHKPSINLPFKIVSEQWLGQQLQKLTEQRVRLKVSISQPKS
jgi:hypothetical protein